MPLPQPVPGSPVLCVPEATDKGLGSLPARAQKLLLALRGLGGLSQQKPYLWETSQVPVLGRALPPPPFLHRALHFCLLTHCLWPRRVLLHNWLVYCHSEGLEWQRWEESLLEKEKGCVP